MTRTKIAILLLVWTAPLAAQPPKFGVSPSTFALQLDGDRPVDESFRVFNYDDQSIDFELEVYNWDLDEANKVRIIPPTEQSLDQWIVLSPVRFTVAGGGSQVVRFSVRPRSEPELGEHRAIVYVVPTPSEEKKRSIRFNFRWGMAIYGYVGETVRTGTLHGVGVGSDHASFDISSLGTAYTRLEGQYSVWPAGTYPGAEATSLIEGLEEGEAAVPEPVLRAGTLPGRTVLPGTRRQVEMPMSPPLPPGDYILDVNGRLGTAVVDMAVPFSVDDEKSGDGS